MLRYKLVQVSEESMLPTLKSGDILLIKKFDQNNIRKVSRNDIVVFNDPITRNKRFIKRIIGLPGEKVQILNTGVILINNKSFKTDFEIYSTGIEHVRYEWILKSEFVVLGDNREMSSDSRQFGAIHEELIIGKVVMKIWPILK